MRAVFYAALAAFAGVASAEVDMHAVLRAHVDEGKVAEAEGDPRDLLSRRDLADLTKEQKKARRAFKKLRKEEGLGNLNVPEYCPKPQDNRFEEDRYCESNFSPQAACGYREVCQIWGDPHVSPFFSDCSEVSLTKRGKFLLYEVPAEEGRTGVTIEGVVTGALRGEYKFVTSMLINGEVKITRQDCVDGTLGYTDEIPLVSDDDEEILLKVGAHCDDRHDWHLNITIALSDSMTGADKSDIDALFARARARNNVGAAMDGSLPDSTAYFANDRGVCTDPLRYNSPEDYDARDKDDSRYGNDPFWLSDSCARPSGGPNGREFSCSAQCAMYGDPHVVDLYTRMNRKKAWVARVDTPIEKIVYSLNPYFAVFMDTDNCHYITKVYLVYQKSELVDAANEGNPDNYHTVVYDVDELCTEEAHWTPETRKRILAPADIHRKAKNDQERVDKEVFNSDVDGFSTGMFVETSTGINAVPRDQEADVESFVNSLSGDPLSIVHSGGVQVILKCHITKEGKADAPDAPDDPAAFTPRKYFNMCVNRRGIDVESLGVGTEGTSTLGGTCDGAPCPTNLVSVENTLHSAGHCAVGRPNWRGFKYRSVENIELPPYNPLEEATDQ